MRNNTSKDARPAGGPNAGPSNAKGISGAFTLIELLAVLAVIGLLASVLLPSLERAKGRAKTAVCQSNLRQFGPALAMSSNDHGKYPLDFTNVDLKHDYFGIVWDIALLPYTARAKEVWFCPANPLVLRWHDDWREDIGASLRGFSYGWNYVGGGGRAGAISTCVPGARENT